PGWPRVEADLDIDPRPDDVAGQHDHSDAVDQLQRRDPLGLVQQHRDLPWRSQFGVAADDELSRHDADPLFAVVELVGRHVLEGLVRRHWRPAGPLRGSAPYHPAGAECSAGIPGPADLLVPEPAAIVVDDLAPRRLVVVVPAVFLSLHPVTGRIGMPALG